MRKIKMVKPELLQDSLRVDDYMDSEVNPIFADDLAAGASLHGHPGMMKSGPNAGQMAEDPTAPKRMTGPGRAKRKKQVEKKLVGRTVVRVRPMTEDELMDEGWELGRHWSPPLVVEFDNGTTLYASQDDEGNGPGALFGFVNDERARFEEES